MSKLIEVILEGIQLINDQNSSRIIVLKDKNKERYIHIWTGPYEAAQLDLVYKGNKTNRPLTFDLITRLVELSNLEIRYVVINKEKEGIFYSVVVINKKENITKLMEVDCRPSDAIVLAIRMKLPIFIESELLKRVGEETREVKIVN
jgi:uncharacterized protein